MRRACLSLSLALASCQCIVGASSPDAATPSDGALSHLDAGSDRATARDHGTALDTGAIHDAGTVDDTSAIHDAGAVDDAAVVDASPLAAVTLLFPGEDDVVSSISPVFVLSLDVSHPGALSLAVEDSSGATLLAAAQTLTAPGPQSLSFPATTALKACTAGRIVIRLNGSAHSRRYGATLFVAGQSNSANWECYACAPTDHPLQRPERIWFLGDSSVPIMPGFASPTTMNEVPAYPLPPLGPTSWVNYPDTVQGIMPIANGRLRGLWPALLDRIGQASEHEYRLVAVGVGGTSISQWADPNYLLKRFGYLTALHWVDAVLWVQGETDANNATPRATYKATLRSIKSFAEQTWMTHLVVKPRWVLFQTTGGPAGCGAQEADELEIRAAFSELVAESPDQFLLGPDFDALPHACHFDTAEEFDAAVQASKDNLLAHFPGL
ncbi:MAG: hypothetical protein JXR83_15515 [Deltaproteobacteria bacterium]|nr:hypothetical protein [Deltaproteobacteria bacterium]